MVINNLVKTQLQLKTLSILHKNAGRIYSFLNLSCTITTGLFTTICGLLSALNTIIDISDIIVPIFSFLTATVIVIQQKCSFSLKSEENIDLSEICNNFYENIKNFSHEHKDNQAILHNYFMQIIKEIYKDYIIRKNKGVDDVIASIIFKDVNLYELTSLDNDGNIDYYHKDSVSIMSQDNEINIQTEKDIVPVSAEKTNPVEGIEMV